MTETRRTRIKDKIAASQERLKPGGAPSPRKLEPLPDRYPPDRFSQLAGEYPLLAVAGGLAAGVVVAALLPRAFGRKFSRRALAAATVASELGLTFGKQAFDAASEASREAREKLGDLGETIDGSTAEVRQRASRAAGTAASSARSTGLKIARGAIRMARDAARRRA